MDILGQQFIDGQRSALGHETLHNLDASTGYPLPYVLYQPTEQEIEPAVAVRSQAQLGHTPLPHLDIHQCCIGVGPVVVFGASNFPLAFSTASSPVLFKTHSGHITAADRVEGAIVRAEQQSSGHG